MNCILRGVTKASLGSQAPLSSCFTLPRTWPSFLSLMTITYFQASGRMTKQRRNRKCSHGTPPLTPHYLALAWVTWVAREVHCDLYPGQPPAWVKMLLPWRRKEWLCQAPSRLPHGCVWGKAACLGFHWETVKDREAWRAAANGVAKSWTQLSN